MTTIGWYGPLINLSEASSHRGYFVQLLVFVHNTLPVQVPVNPSFFISSQFLTIVNLQLCGFMIPQYKTSRGGNVIRTDIQVGDETRTYFPVSIWGKHVLNAGNIVLLQSKYLSVHCFYFIYVT